MSKAGPALRSCVPLLIAAAMLAGCDAAPMGACTPSDTVICGIVKPEDIEIVPESSCLLVSELGNASSPGRIIAIDAVTSERRVLVEGPIAAGTEAGFPRCGPPPSTFKPRGFHLSRDPAGERLLVIAGQRIEQFRLKREDDLALAWEGCVDIPADIAANDIAGLPDGGFVVSHMYDPPRDWTLDLRMFFGIDTGAAIAWSAADGWRRVPNTDAAFANGIQVDPATERIFVSSMFTQRVIVVDRDGSNRRETARGPNQIDNLTWAADGRLIGAGHTGVPVYGIRTCREIGDRPCSFPFAITAIDPKTLAIETLFESRTGPIPGASVAALRDGTLYLGTAFGDRITKVSLGPSSPSGGIRKAYVDGPHGQVHTRIATPPTASQKTPVALFHPTPFSGVYYRYLIPELAKDRVVIAPDTPGYGGSDRPAAMPSMETIAAGLGQVIDRLGYRSVDAVASHTGALIAIELAVQRPDLVRRLAIASLPYHPPGAERQALYDSAARETPYTIDGTHVTDYWNAAILRRVALAEADPAQLDRAHEMFVDRATAGRFDWWGYHATYTYPSEQRIPQLKQPTLLFNPLDRHDENMKQARSLFATHDYVEVPDAGWVFWDTHAPEMATLIRNFLDSAP